MVTHIGNILETSRMRPDKLGASPVIRRPSRDEASWSGKKSPGSGRNRSECFSFKAQIMNDIEWFWYLNICYDIMKCVYIYTKGGSWNGDWWLVGKMLFASHPSLRHGMTSGSSRSCPIAQVEEKLSDYLANSPHCKLEFCRRGPRSRTVLRWDGTAMIFGSRKLRLRIDRLDLAT